VGGGEKGYSGLAVPDWIDISMAASIIVLPGIVRRKQHETKCEVLARRSLSAEGLSYTDGFVLNAPAGLADSEYIVIFDHHTMRTTNARGLASLYGDCAAPGSMNSIRRGARLMTLRWLRRARQSIHNC
jgi:hypothetical protein